MTIRRMLWGVMILAALLCLIPTANRFRTEQRNRRVEIALDITEVRKLAAAEGKPLNDTLSRLKDSGATSVLVQEDTLDSLRDLGIIEILPSTKHQTTLMIVHQRQFDRIKRNLENRTAVQMAIPEQFSGTDLEDAGIVVSDRWDAIKDLGVGIDPEVVDLVRSSGLSVVGRVGNNPNPSDSRIASTLQSIRDLKIETVIFSGMSVLGAGNRYKETVEHLSDEPKLRFGSVEFGKQAGDASLVKQAPYNTIRVHTITSSEMATATPGANIQRFALAARERNIRLLFVRLFLDGADPLDNATSYLSGLRNALYRSQLGVGTARTYTRIGNPFLGRVAAGVVIVSGIALLLDFTFGFLTIKAAPTMIGASIALIAVVFVTGVMPALKLVSLIGACALPSLGVAILHPEFVIPGSTTIKRLLLVFAVTMLGPLTVVAIHADTLFLVKGDVFLGVKLTLIAPLIVAALLHGLNIRADSPAGLAAVVRDRVTMLVDISRNPILIWQVLLGGGVLVALAIMLMRSGNESSVGVSSIELQLRSLLDRILFVRPRFKDILFQPFVMLSLILVGTKWPLQRVAAILASIALASMVNTFCHLHTPLVISALRVAYGVIFGLITAAVVKRIIDRFGLVNREEAVVA
ncbi:MAG: hypothetical protein RLZZ78_611 [Armatimonadota bacterium]